MKEKGFSIIELLLVVGIIAIVPIIVISNFPEARLQFALSRTAYAFAQNVRETQNMALESARYKDAFGIMQAVAGYGIYLDVPSLGETVYLRYGDTGNRRYDKGDYQESSFQIEEEGIIIKELRGVFANKASITFATPTAEATITQLNQGANSLEVVFAIASRPSVIKSVVVYSSGLVEIK